MTIAKSLLPSQYTYIGSVIDIDEPTAELIQQMLNNLIMHNCKHDPIKTKRNWLNKEVFFGHTSQGGLNLPKVSEFLKGFKCSWIRHYAVSKLDDHWADQINSFLNLTPDTWEDMLIWGSEKFNEIDKSVIPCVAVWFQSYKQVKHNFPTDYSFRDNLWFTQPIFLTNQLKLNKEGKGQVMRCQVISVYPKQRQNFGFVMYIRMSGWLPT